MSSADSSHRSDEQPLTLIWIDARKAVLAAWDRGAVRLEHVIGALPPQERSVGHVRLDPAVRHGGGQRQDKLEHRRYEREQHYLEAVVARVPAVGAVEILGPGELRLHLARRLRRSRAGATRSIATEPAGPLTEAQLIARLRALVGHPARRQLALAR